MKEASSLNKEFASRELNEVGLMKVAIVRNNFNQLLDRLLGLAESGVSVPGGKLVPEGRELSIVRTKLEEACMFAVKAVANDPANQK